MNAEMERLAQQILAEAMTRFPLRQLPRLRWKPLRVSAGIAYYRKGEIGLSSILLDTPDRLRVTLLHEYAHLLAVERHGRRGANHGPYWKQAMDDLGLEPRVRHNYDVERNAARQSVVYRCRRCGSEIRRSRRLPRNRKYVHARCGGDLELKEIATRISQDA